MATSGSEDHKRLYEIWKSFCRRCHDPKRKDYPKYGARGIRVCDEWRGTSDPHDWCYEGFLVFKKWAQEHGYREDMTIDRISNNRGYGPGNCRWISKKAQAYNRRTNTYYTLDGKTQTIAQWSKETGLPDYVICKRMAKGWGVEKTLRTPLKTRKILKQEGELTKHEDD